MEPGWHISPACQRHFYLFMMAWKQNVVGTEAFISLKRIGALPIFFQDVMEDAGNSVYLVLMRLIAPQFLLDTYPPNVTPEVVGNLVESLLGYFMLRPAQPDSLASFPKLYHFRVTIHQIHQRGFRNLTLKFVNRYTSTFQSQNFLMEPVTKEMKHETIPKWCQFTIP